MLSGLALQTSASQLMTALHRHFDLVSLESSAEQVPEPIKTLMVVHPAALPERTLYAIEQFVLRGGKLLMFIDPISEISTSALPANTRLDGLLTGWGIHMPADKLLVDKLYAAFVPAEAGEPHVRHPARLNLPREAMNPNDISNWKLDTVTVSSSGALSRLKKSRTTFTPLLQSSGQSALIDATRFAATRALESATDTLQRHVIAARIEGPAYSTFPDGIKGLPPGLQKTTQAHVVVVADTDLLMDSTRSLTPDDNALFVLNTLDNMSAAGALANIRPRVTPERSPNVLEKMRGAAEQAYREKALELEQRLQQTEQEWQRLSPQEITLGTQSVNPTTQLQALNKERLRLPMELHALQVEAYAQVHRLEDLIKLGVSLVVPLTLGLVGWGVLLSQRRRRLRAADAFY